MVNPEFLAITLVLANFAAGIVFWAIAIDLWSLRRPDTMATYIVIAYALAGTTFFVVSALGSAELSVIRVAARLARKVMIIYLALVVYSYLKDGYEPLFEK